MVSLWFRISPRATRRIDPSMPPRLRCLLAWLFLAPFAAGAGVRPVTLGFIVPPSEPDATSLLRGVQLAVAEANETGGGAIELEVSSTAGQWGTVGNDAVALVCARHVDAMIAPSDGGASHLILQVAGRTQVPVACVCADSSVTNAGVPWAIRVVPRTDEEAEALFAAALRAGPPNRPPLHWWAVVPAGRPGRAVRRDLETAARSTLTALDRIVEGGVSTADLAPLARAIVAAAPGGVLLWLPPSRAGTVAAALRAAGYGGRLAGPSPLGSQEFVAAAGAAAMGVLVTAFSADADSRARAEKFERRYRQRYDAQPDFSAAAAYDAVRVLIETLHRAGDRAGYRQFPPAFSTVGVTGVLHFDNSGNRTDALQVLTCQQGQFVPILPTAT